MRHLIVGVIVTVVYALTSQAAQACSCAGPGTSCAAVSRADAVFVGRVLIAGTTVRFAVERTIVGAPVPEIAIGNGPGNCGLNFEANDRYVVYAYRVPSTGGLMTSMCTRTRPLSDPRTRADLAYFDLMSQPSKRGGLLTGIVADATRNLADRTGMHRGLDGIEISLTPGAGGLPLATTTRADGTFELTGVPVGTFRLVATLPRYFETPPPTTVTMRTADGCEEANISTRVDGRIRGRLLDEHGRPGRGIQVHLADPTRARDEHPLFATIDAVTDEQGEFEFRYVGPGRYVVGVGLHAAVRSGQLDRRRFYAQTRDPAAATIVNLGIAERVQLSPFTLAPLPSDRTVTVILQAPAGDVAAATKLFLTGSTREPLEHRGTPVTLRLPFGAGYVIEAAPPEGHRIKQHAVRIERDDTDRTIEFRVERQ